MEERDSIPNPEGEAPAREYPERESYTEEYPDPDLEQLEREFPVVEQPDPEPTPASAVTRIPGGTWFIIIVISFFAQMAWAVENNFFNLFIQDTFGASLSDVAMMVSLSALTATATTLFVGAWSDRKGRRKLFVVTGTFLWGFSILVFAFLQQISFALAGTAAAAAALGITLTIVFDCVMTFFGSVSNDSAFNAWVTDITDDTNRGKVEGVMSAMPLLALLAVFGGAMFFMVVTPDGFVTYDYPVFFTILGVGVLVVGVLALIFMKDSHPVIDDDSSYIKDVLYGFRPVAVLENRMLYLVLAGFCVFSMALQVFMPYYVLYLRLPYILGESYVFVMAPGIIIAAIFTILYGRSVDRFGFAKAVILPVALFIVGCLVLTFFADVAMVFIGSALMLSGYLGAQACFGAEVRNRTPLNRVGLFQGIRIFMVVLIPMLVGPWIGSAISASPGTELAFGVVGDGFTPSSLIFLGGAAVAALSYIIIGIIAGQRSKETAVDEREGE